MHNLCFTALLILSIFSVIAASQSLIEYLSRFSGKLPFTLETGYIGVGKIDEVQLFYYFIESKCPGCFDFSALAHGIANYNGTLPTVLESKYSWTKVANIIFIDPPVGTGFSYATASSGYYTSNTKSAAPTYTFLRMWLLKHPNFLGNQLYIGDSYSGISVPLLLKHIRECLEVGLRPGMELQGYLLGKLVTDSFSDVNFRIPYVHRVNLISDELYENAKLYCSEDYVNVDINKKLCVNALQAIMEEDRTMNYLLSQSKLPELRCRGFTYVLAYKWLNDERVREALHGTVESWKRCPQKQYFSTYTEDVTSTFAYQKNLTETGLRALIYGFLSPCNNCFPAMRMD
ncbi:hypothetical protein I3842_05G020900 [Carya illinoinensis]|uniref:Serine carboxypeptidase-like 18 n=1 Tax=Carya illinoinensis TaxID=32201 RepID=A0A922EZ12_CARIL|nr:hypothetical protein I3842_05G020900 [Carya illinoinensis]